jgi:hypothetical protein
MTLTLTGLISKRWPITWVPSTTWFRLPMRISGVSFGRNLAHGEPLLRTAPRLCFCCQVGAPEQFQGRADREGADEFLAGYDIFKEASTPVLGRLTGSSLASALAALPGHCRLRQRRAYLNSFLARV